MAYTDDQKANALNLWTEHGACEASRRTGIPRGTISSWAKRAQLAPPVAAGRTLDATERARQAWALRRAEMADELGELAAEAITMTREAIAKRSARNARDGAATVETLVRNAQLLDGHATSRTEATISDQRSVVGDAKDRGLRLVDNG